MGRCIDYPAKVEWFFGTELQEDLYYSTVYIKVE